MKQIHYTNTQMVPKKSEKQNRMNNPAKPVNYVPSIRCIVPPEAWTSSTVTLDEAESHHLVRVLRLTEGAEVRVLDGEGRWADGFLESAHKKAAVVRCETIHTEPSPRPKIMLVQSLIKHARMELVIQKMVELGCAELIPVAGDRSVVKGKGSAGEHQRERMQAIALAALKQSCGYRLPLIHAPKQLQEVLEVLQDCPCRYYGALEPESKTFREALRGLPAAPARIALFVGPEGDYSERERALLREANVTPVSLGPTVLRSETAAFYMLGAVRYEFDETPGETV
ncbi:MAG: RsmE family RNA methyltransferase [Kiritimatiellae bacterium]|nr:RsmE family RNA methyltransferase [Kiritimatiellia bacterium]